MEVKLIDGTVLSDCVEMQEEGQFLTFISDGNDYAVPFSSLLWVKKTHGKSI